MEDAARQESASEESPAPPSRRLGPYEVIRELGRGSNGVVYEALKEDDHQRVALKVLPANIALNRKTVSRFRREAQAASNLDHAGIVRVLAIGEDDDTHFFAMEYVEGVPLDRYAEGHDLTVRDAARLIRDAARALHFAHENGVIHRDVKPSNLLVRADGNILVSDFGLARLDKSATLTSTDAIVGTPKYMSPEQILAEKGQVDRRADVYALAVTLFELVAKQHPFEGDTVQAFLKNVLEAEPRRPRAYNRRVPRDLETIVLKGMRRDIDRRYQTALELAEDLDRFLRKKPIRARPPGQIQRAFAWSRRHRLGVLTVALLVTILASVAVVLLTVRGGTALRDYQEKIDEARGSLVGAQRDSDAAARRARLEKAERLLGEAMSVSGRRPEAYALRSRVRFWLGRYEEAKHDLAAAAERGASAGMIAPVRAHFALLNQDWMTAIATSTLALQMDPNDADLLYIRGAARVVKGALTQGKQDLAECLLLSPDHAEARKLLYEIADMTGDSAEKSRLEQLGELLRGIGGVGAEGAGMLATLTDLVSQAARDSPALSAIGRSLFRRLVLSRESRASDSADEAIEQATAEIDADPSQHRAYFRRGRAYVLKGMIPEAVRDFSRSIDEDQTTSESGLATDWEPCFWLAFVLVTSAEEDVLWDEPTAERYALLAVVLAESSEAPLTDISRAKDVLAEVLFRSGRRDEALREMEDLIIEDEDRADYYRRRKAYFEEPK